MSKTGRAPDEDNRRASCDAEGAFPLTQPLPSPANQTTDENSMTRVDSLRIASSGMTVSISTPSDREGKAGRFGWLWWIVLLALVTLLWCAAYNRWTTEAWQTPVVYEGDAWAEMGT